MADRQREARKGEVVGKGGGLIERSAFGTIGARQLRDRTSGVSRDRALLQAYFSATTEGRAWWHAHRNDADALYNAANSFAGGEPEDRAISERLMNLAAALGHPGACAGTTSESDGRPSQPCPVCVPSAGTEEPRRPPSPARVPAGPRPPPHPTPGTGP